MTKLKDIKRRYPEFKCEQVGSKQLFKVYANGGIVYLSYDSEYAVVTDSGDAFFYGVAVSVTTSQHLSRIRRNSPVRMVETNQCHLYDVIATLLRRPIYA